MTRLRTAIERLRSCMLPRRWVRSPPRAGTFGKTQQRSEQCCAFGEREHRQLTHRARPTNTVRLGFNLRVHRWSCSRRLAPEHQLNAGVSP